MTIRTRQFILCGAVMSAVIPVGRAFADYRLERVLSGLAQPDFIAQAPGDPSNVVYYSTRIAASSGTGGGFGTVNNMGGIYRYDMATRTSTLVMSLNYRQLTGDEGLVGFAFSPDYNTPGAPGYQKMYVSSSAYNGGSSSPIERVEEYTVNGANGTVPLDASNHPVISRTVLQYTNVNAQQNHTVDWIGFDPTTYSQPVGSPARNYLFISTGDGDLGGTAQSRPEQKPTDIRGKLLRVDVDSSHPDAYPTGDTSSLTRNYAIPTTNPIPLYNAAHPGANLASTTVTYSNSPSQSTYGTASTLAQEIYFTGTRNSFRWSIDRQTGDLWGGDVGENTREEINFLKAGTYDGSTPPVDFGYASREGTTTSSNGATGTSASTTLQWNTTTGGAIIVNSTNPVREGDHSATNTTDHPLGARSAYIGGYVYRGPIPELQGKYIYADYVNSNVFTLAGIDRNMSLASYSGTNFNQNASGLAALGTRTTVADSTSGSLWNTLAYDPNDPNYTLANFGTQFGLGRVVSFGEDNSGNVYLIDFGGDRGDVSFNNDYPNAGQGEIFRLVLVSAVHQWNINGGGTWSSNPNWTPAAPLTIGDSANFLGAVTSGTATITLDGNQIAGSLTFNDSSGSYTIAKGVGNGNLYLNNGTAPAAITVSAGSHTINTLILLQSAIGSVNTTNIAVSNAASVLTLSAGIIGNSAVINLSGPGKLLLSGPTFVDTLNMAAGSNLQLSGAGNSARVNALILAHSGSGSSAIYSTTLNLADSKLVVQTTSALDKSNKIAALVEAVNIGSNGGTWTGAGITSSAAAADSAHYGVGVFDNAILGFTSFGGTQTDTTSILTAISHLGDANRNGIVDIQDLTVVANNWQQNRNNWAAGDLNRDGIVDIQDFTIVANNWQETSGFALDPGAVFVLSVPEPTALSILALGGASLLLPRRKRR